MSITETVKGESTPLRMVAAIAVAVIMLAVIAALVVLEVTGADHVQDLITAVATVVLPTTGSLLAWREVTAPAKTATAATPPASPPPGKN